MHPAATRASEEIFSCGYARVKLSMGQAARLQAAVAEARAFFELPAQQRTRYANTQENLGYRGLGHEYPGAGRPDWNECFTICSDRTDLIPHSREISAFTGSLLAWRSSVLPLVTDLLNRISEHFGAAPALTGLDRSFLQVNSYSLGPSDRDLLQDPHEDGYLITIIHTTAAGLEVSLDGGQGVPVQTESDEVLIVPGEILGDLTQQRIRAVRHQVRNLNLSSRLSVMYFAGPDLSEPLYEWGNDTQENQPLDLRARIHRRPTPIRIRGNEETGEPYRSHDPGGD